VSDGPPPSTSLLQAAHERLGARFTEFAGWTMPLQYEGALAEHAAVRTGAGIFDVSHLGRFALHGPGSTNTLRRMLCNDITDVGPGRAQYTLMLTSQGGVVDDLIVWRLDGDTAWVLPNGVNHERVMAAIAAEAAPDATATDRRPETALLAVQGPKAPGLVKRVIGAAPKRFRVIEAEFDGTAVVAAGTGYTGEKGAEIAVPADAAQALWEALLEAGAVPCGLGARDILRLEMGYPLWGQDLDTSTTPLEAGLGWVVEWDHEFTGRAAVAAQRTGGLPKLLIGFATEGRTIPRTGHLLRCGSATGRVTSGGFSPALGVGIGMGYVSPDPGTADEVVVSVRDKQITAARIDPPFI
jgi:aminomethyltransferase